MYNRSILSLGEGIYSCTITDANECTTNIQDTIHKFNPMHIIGIIGHPETCNQQNGSIEITFDGGTPPYQYLWSSADGSSGSEITHLISDYYFVTVTDQYGCVDTTSIRINNIGFSASVLETTPSYCERNVGSVILSLTGTIENPQIDWGPILNHNYLYVDHLSGGRYTVYVEDYGCTDTVTFEIEEIPKPIACFEIDPNEELAIDQMVYFDNCSTQGNIYEWNFGNGSTHTGFNAQHSYNHGGQYQVTLFTSNEYGCTDSTSTFIVVRGKGLIYTPNAFTPDQDGFNKVFLPIFSYVNEVVYQFTIFNRLGQVVFYTINPEEGWDGTFRNTEAPSGTYSFVIIYKNETG